MAPVIHWFRRDLRVADNTSLHHAAATGSPVITVYILSTWKKNHAWTGPNRQKFLCGSLEVLAKSLQKLQGALLIREGDQLKALKSLVSESGANAIYLNRVPDPFGRKQEEKLAKLCQDLEIDCHMFDDVALHHPDEIRTQTDTPYKVFTPYSKKWLSCEKPKVLPTPKKLNSPKDLDSLDLPTLAHWSLQDSEAEIPQPGEANANKRMKEALSKSIPSYSKNRDIPSAEATSRLSQDLRHGTLSIRTLYANVAEALSNAKGDQKKSIETYIKELAWREFYFAILYHFPHVLDHEFNEDWKGLPWSNSQKMFDKWKAGETGFPIVDAGMRQLLKTGFIHNRVRMITAMFLTKDLHIDWKRGESHFMQHLTDGEIGSNNGGWQWSAGTGADAAPYFRIQNPWTQTERFDPKGGYIKKWIPELKDVAPKKFQSPPPDGESLAENYPAPCVNHKSEREETIAIFKKHKNKQA